MPRIQVQALVPASPEAVYEHVTAFAVSGRTGRRALEEKYGRLVGRDGDTYTFREETKEDTEEGVTWSCTFNPPTRRVMQAPGSRWADRVDWFEPWEEGTLWTVMWEGNPRGFRVFTQWLGFLLWGKKRAYAGIMRPVVRHFEEVSGNQPGSVQNSTNP